ITDSDLIAQAFVEAVAPPEKNLPSLLRHLHSRQALLIVDNCEHFVEGVAQLVELIVRRCVGVTVLATSREHLGVSGEAVFRVPPLSQKTSVRLLMERSRLREPGLSAPNQTSSEVLTRIADRLDGIPLALELVAGALDMLTPEQVLAGLDARFEMPLTGSRTASPRHQTLRATVEWSHDLLGPEEKLLFRRLAIFRSSFTLESAEAICADSSIPAPQIALVLRHLIDKSLVVVGTGIGGPSRYRIFETIRAFAWEHLQAEGDLPDLRRRQAAFLAEMAIGAETKLSGAAAEHWLSEMSEEQPNLGMVLEWARTEDPSVVLRLSAAWWPYWILSGHIRAGQGWLEGALATDVDDLPVQMAALHGAGRAACRKGDFDLAQSNFDRQLALATMLEDRGQQVMALNAMGLMKAAWEDWSAAQSDFSLAQSLAEGGDIRLLAMTRSNLGICIARNGNLARAKRAFAQAYSVMLAAGDRNGIARQSLLLGELALVEGQLDEARELLKASVLDYMRLGDQFFVIATLKAFAHWLAVAGAEELSLRVAGAVEAAQTQMGVTGWASPHETARRAARARAWQSLGPDLATRAESAGATASTADAMEEALTWTPPHCTEAPPSRLRAFAPE
ncbi:MAG TPA: hypothetical protein VG015_10310, partial [Candidatus Dormibacteraeota bacterium]|nr:hypothetical protein [Candidatus Dormibacteraeota bacterium]